MKKTTLSLILSTLLFIGNYLGQTNHTVSTAGMSFSPSSLTVNANDTVTFICTSGTHNVNGTQATFPNNPESFGNSLGSGWTYQHVFTIAGTYNYQCDPHAAGGMVGSIVVQPITGNLVIQGVMDFTLPQAGSSGKALHFTVDGSIPDLSVFGVGVANNGGGTDGQEYTFPSGTANAGDHILVVRDSAAIAQYFSTCMSSFTHLFVDGSGVISQNGDDAIELFKNNTVIDLFGDVNVDGTGQPWEYKDAWAYRTGSGPNNGIWDVNQWTYGAPDCTDGDTLVTTSACPYPYCPSIPPPPPVTYDVTLSVNTATITVGANGMYAGGGVLGDAMAVPLSDPDGDGTWTGVATIIAGTTGNYIFLNSPTSGGDWGAKEDLTGLACADPNNWNDRTFPNITSDTTMLHCFGSCETDGSCPNSPPPTPQSNVTFKVDMSQVTAGFTTPELNATFNSWCGNCNPMSDADGDEIWEVTIALDSGLAIEYKFSADAWSIQEQNDPTASCTNGDTTNTNRVLVVPSNDTVLSDVCWGSCDPCSSSITQNELNDVLVYPNPVGDVLNIKSIERLNSIIVKDLTGRVVMLSNPNSTNVSLDVSLLSNNIYFVECHSINGLSIHKIIISN